MRSENTCGRVISHSMITRDDNICPLPVILSKHQQNIRTARFFFFKYCVLLQKMASPREGVGKIFSRSRLSKGIEKVKRR